MVPEHIPPADRMHHEAGFTGPAQPVYEPPWDCAAYLRDNRAVGVVCYGVRHHRAVGTEGIAWQVARGVGFHVAEMRIAKSDGRTGIRYR